MQGITIKAKTCLESSTNAAKKLFSFHKGQERLEQVSWSINYSVNNITTSHYLLQKYSKSINTNCCTKTQSLAVMSERSR